MALYSGYTDPDYKTMVFYSAPLLCLHEGHFSNTSPGLMLRVASMEIRSMDPIFLRWVYDVNCTVYASMLNVLCAMQVEQEDNQVRS